MSALEWAIYMNKTGDGTNDGFFSGTLLSVERVF